MAKGPNERAEVTGVPRRPRTSSPSTIRLKKRGAPECPTKRVSGDMPTAFHIPYCGGLDGDVFTRTRLLWEPTMLRMVLSLAIFLGAAVEGRAAADDCDEVRPFRAIELETAGSAEGDFDASLFYRLLGISGGLEGKMTIREAFPAIEQASSLSDKQYLHYIACKVILTSDDISSAERMALLMDWRNESRNDIEQQFIEDLNSDSTLDQISAIDWALNSGNNTYRALAIEKAIQSESPAIKGRLVELFLRGSSAVSGSVVTKSQSREEEHSFSIIFDEWSRTEGPVNFSGRFAGGVFRLRSQGSFSSREEKSQNELLNVVGTVRGNSIHASNDFCTASGKLIENDIVGRISCMGPVRLNLRGNTPAGGQFTIPLFSTL